MVGVAMISFLQSCEKPKQVEEEVVVENPVEVLESDTVKVDSTIVATPDSTKIEDKTK